MAASDTPGFRSGCLPASDVRAGLLAGYQHSRRVKGLVDGLIADNTEFRGLDQLRHPPLHLATPEGGGDASQNFVDPIEHWSALADQNQREPAFVAQHSMKLADGAQDVIRR